MMGDGGGTTRIVVRAAFPAPPSVELTALVVLRKFPVAIASTFTLKMQLALGSNVAPDRLTTPEPAVAVMVPPPQLPNNPFGVATANPAGSVSVKPIPVSVRARLGLFKTKFRRVT